MAVYWDRRSFSGAQVLGIAPHRQMNAERGGSDARAMARIERFFSALRKAGRRSVFIVDNKCGDGGLLIRAAKRARALGFLAIEAKGFDRSPAHVSAARASALAGRDPAIGFSFVVREDGAPLPVEDDEADLMLAAQGEDEAAEIAASPIRTASLSATGERGEDSSRGPGRARLVRAGRGDERTGSGSMSGDTLLKLVALAFVIGIFVLSFAINSG